MTKKIPISKLRGALETIDMKCRGSDEGYTETILGEWDEPRWLAGRTEVANRLKNTSKFITTWRGDSNF